MFPGIREEDFFHSHMEPIKKAIVAPASSDAPDAIFHLAEGTFNGIGIEWEPELVFKPPVEEGTNAV